VKQASESTSADLVRRAFDALNEFDADALISIVDDQIEFFPLTRLFANNGRPYRGHEGMRKYLSDVAELWEELRVEPRRYTVAGDQVAVYGRVCGRSGRGTTVDAPADWIWQVRDGKIVWGCVFGKRDEARRAIGRFARSEDAEALIEAAATLTAATSWAATS
jgi:ketosteroid isomerase-like protein